MGLRLRKAEVVAEYSKGQYPILRKYCLTLIMQLPLLYVKVLFAKGLTNADLKISGVSDPYCVSIVPVGESSQFSRRGKPFHYPRYPQTGREMAVQNNSK
eukprot:Platyproteum_vivax@DN7692_c1_g1_i22.p1